MKIADPGFAVRDLATRPLIVRGAFGVSVNSVSFTGVSTGLGKSARAGETGESAIARIPVGRFAEPREIAAAAMPNGADLIIDGG